jgi:hypothetical protein
MGILQKSIFGIIRLDDINPYNNEKGAISFYMKNGGNEDYKLTIIQDDVIGYAGVEEIKMNMKIEGTITTSKIQDWTQNGYIGVEFDLTNDRVLQREINGNKITEIGEVYVRYGRIHIKKSEDTDRNLPLSQF